MAYTSFKRYIKKTVFFISFSKLINFLEYLLYIYITQYKYCDRIFVTYSNTNYTYMYSIYFIYYCTIYIVLYIQMQITDKVGSQFLRYKKLFSNLSRLDVQT